MKHGEHSRGGGQNSISTILLIVSFMWVEFKYVFCAVLCSLFSDQMIAM